MDPDVPDPLKFENLGHGYFTEKIESLVENKNFGKKNFDKK